MKQIVTGVIERTRISVALPKKKDLGRSPTDLRCSVVLFLSIAK